VADEAVPVPVAEHPADDPRRPPPPTERRCRAPAGRRSAPQPADPLRRQTGEGSGPPPRPPRPEPPRAPEPPAGDRDVVPTPRPKYAKGRVSTGRTGEVRLGSDS